MELTLCILSTIGLVVITNLSTLFRPLREKLSMLAAVKKKNIVVWFLSNIFNCHICMSPYAGGVVYVCYSLKLTPVLYILSGVPCVMFFMSLNKLIERK